MKLITTDKQGTQYKSNDLINKHYYVNIKNREFNCYYIFVIKDIRYNDVNYNITYECERCFCLAVPIIKAGRHAYLYDNYNSVTINYNYDKLYELSMNEYLNTFKMFIKCDNMLADELPVKIIQDI